jgi:ATP-binding cassette, subfamily C (CFTR/MRP), member 1
MARAVYRDADVTLLDDCLSAVDAHVGRDLFDKCIIENLLNQKRRDSGKRRTVILVTNSLQYLSNSAVDRIVVLSGGRIVESGKYMDLVSRKDSYFKKYLSSFTESLKSTSDKSGTQAGDKTARLVDAKGGLNELPLGENQTTTVDSTRDSSSDKKARSLMTDEMAERKIGKVRLEVYASWLKAAGGFWVIVPILLGFSISACIKILSNWWLTYWSHSATSDASSQLHFLFVYGIINVAAMFADFIRMLVVMLFGLVASRKLFEGLLDSTLRAPMSFYDTTPAGRIMNRFSKDMYTIDEAVPNTASMYLDCMFSCISTLVVITYVTPWFAAVLPPMLFFYRKQQAYFSQCYRELKRLDSVNRSPLYQLFGETLEGYVTIRAFDAQPSLLNRMEGLIDKQQHAYYLTQAGLCWLAVRLELVGTAIIFCACLAAVLEKQSHPDGNELFAGLGGLSISYALQITQTLNWAVRTGSDFEANMVSVERIEEYTREAPQEAPQHTEADEHLDETWPSNGEIQFKHVSLRYRPGLPRVLKELNLTIPGRAKVGVVGRTGAGKSTLMTALMRLVELDGGNILLDGIDTRPVGLRKLRSNIAVIPQDPVLFSGTIKTNLDPFNEHQKDRLMDVLSRVGLWNEAGGSSNAVRSLDDVVQQDGNNFSAGQRQLLVIGRALLDGAAIVIIDEATSSIDAESDSRIQKVLRSEFSKATTLTIAHRLNTIMDSSHILVMSDGKAVEFDSPNTLLSKGGLFKDLVDKWEEEHE